MQYNTLLSKNMDNNQTIDDFLIWLRSGHTAATLSSYQWAIHSFQKWLKINNKPFSKMTVSDIARYAQYLENQGLKGGTRSHYITALKTMWRWLYSQKMVSFPDTMIPLPNRDDTTSYDFLEHEDFNLIMNQFNEFFPKDLRDKTVVSLLFATGMRLGELLSLNVSDIDTASRTAIVQTFKRKNHKREIFWDAETSRLLVKWITARQMILDDKKIESSALFISLNTKNTGDRLARHGVQRIFRDARRGLHLSENITPHSCRHGFASRGVKNNVNIRYLQVMMGHANIKSTQVYMGYHNSDIENEYRKIYA